jgi:dolichyl-phosphate beta-glucosyltransferase
MLEVNPTEMRPPRPALTVVMPARNEAARLPGAVERVGGFLAAHGSAELVVAADVHSHDGTFAVAEARARAHPAIRAVPVERAGKRNALIVGVEAARGRMILTADTDLAVDPCEFPRLLREAGPRVVVMASRSVAGSRRVGEPIRRYLLGRAFNLVVRAFILPGLKDTQCGFKVFPRDAGLALLRRLSVESWVFDVELLALAGRDGFDLVEVPVTWRYGDPSSVRLVRDVPRVVNDLWKVGRELRRTARVGAVEGDSDKIVSAA